MSTNFPSSLDSLSNPSGGDRLSTGHSDQHANANDAIEALQAKVGVDSSGVTSSLDYKVAQLNANALLSSAIGTTVQAYDADTAKLDVAQSWTAQQTFKELKDTVHTIADGAAFEIDPANGSVQVVTLGASRTPKATNFEAGQTVLLGVDDGSAYSITWTDATFGTGGTGGNGVRWVKGGGSAAAPTLATSGYTWILLWKVGSQVYGGEVGQP